VVELAVGAPVELVEVPGGPDVEPGGVPVEFSPVLPELVSLVEGPHGPVELDVNTLPVGLKHPHTAVQTRSQGRR
jgi:hypothetical protein